MSDSDLASRRIYLPCMSDHAYAVAAAMRAQGLEAEVLPPPTDESLAIGLGVCRGRECLPCFLCVGDFLKKCREPGFDPARAVFFMPTGPGPCRFGQYHVLQEAILREEGFGDVRIVSPTTNDSYALFGDNPQGLRKRAWQGIVAVDLLIKLLHEHRPYELETGATDEVYGRSLREVVGALEQGGGPALIGALRRAGERFATVPVDLSESRPLVGIVGELYVLLCSRANLEIVKLVEDAGGEVLLGTFMDWLYFVDWSRKERALFCGDYRDYLGGVLSDSYQRLVERRSVRAVGRALRHPPESPVSEAVKRLRFCYDPTLGTEAVLTMGRILDLAHHGLDGVINVLPFSCMPGMVVAAMGPKLRERMNGLPWLDVSYDGQKATNLNTRLQAFMHQARQFERRVRAGSAAHSTWPQEDRDVPAPTPTSAASRRSGLPMLHSAVLLGALLAGTGGSALGQVSSGASCGAEASACGAAHRWRTTTPALLLHEEHPLLAEIRTVLDTAAAGGDEDATREVVARAVGSARQAVIDLPASAEAHYLLAAAVGLQMEGAGLRTKLSMAGEVREAAEAALALDPEHAGAHHILGRLHAGAMRLGKVQRFVAVRLLGAATLANVSWENAETHFARAAELDPADPRHSMELGALYLDTARSERAVAELGRAAALTPHSAADRAAVARAQDLLASVR